MTVKELIDALSQLDPNLKVATSTGDEYLWEVGAPEEVPVGNETLVILDADDGTWTAPISDVNGKLISPGHQGY